MSKMPIGSSFVPQAPLPTQILWDPLNACSKNVCVTRLLFAIKRYMKGNGQLLLRYISQQRVKQLSNLHFLLQSYFPFKVFDFKT